MEKNPSARFLKGTLKKKITFFFIITGNLFTVNGQNLICNAGFEEFYTCPKTINFENPKKFIPCWDIPTKGTPDYFNACSRFNVGVPDNNLGSQFAKDGNGYIGLVLFEKKTKSKDLNYREYLSCKLSQPTRTDSLYEVSFYYTPSSYSTYTINQLHIGFCEKKPTTISKIIQPDYFVGIDTTNILIPNGNWNFFCDTIRVNKKYEYVVLGNFKNDKQTKWVTLDISEIRKSLQEVILDNQAAYYYIDMVDLHLLIK